MHGVQSMPHAMLQGAFDGIYTPGDQWYWRADFVDEIPDEAVLAAWEQATGMFCLNAAPARAIAEVLARPDIDAVAIAGSPASSSSAACSVS